MDKDTVAIEVAYALPDKQAIVPLRVPQGCTAVEAVHQSGMDNLFPGLSLDDAKLGVFGKLLAKPHDYHVKPGDRIEIYRPLILDLKAVRKQRADEAKLVRKGKPVL